MRWSRMRLSKLSKDEVRIDRWTTVKEDVVSGEDGQDEIDEEKRKRRVESTKMWPNKQITRWVYMGSYVGCKDKTGWNEMG